MSCVKNIFGLVGMASYLLLSVSAATSQEAATVSVNDWLTSCGESSPPFTVEDINKNRQCNAIYNAAYDRFDAQFNFSIDPFICGNAGRSINDPTNFRPSGEERSRAYNCLFAYHVTKKACGYERNLQSVISILREQEIALDAPADESIYSYLLEARNDVACQQAISAFLAEFEPALKGE